MLNDGNFAKIEKNNKNGAIYEISKKLWYYHILENLRKVDIAISLLYGRLYKYVFYSTFSWRKNTKSVNMRKKYVMEEFRKSSDKLHILIEGITELWIKYLRK